MADQAGARTIEVNVCATMASDAFQEHRIGPASIEVVKLAAELLA